MIRALLPLAILGLSACASLPPSMPGDALLVTIEMGPHSSPAPTHSNTIRSYASPEDWTAPPRAHRNANVIARDHDLDIITAWPLTTLGELCLVVTGPARVLERLERDSRVVSAQRIRHYVALEQRRYNDDRIDIQLGDQAEALARLHEWATGKGVRVGIVDSPIDRAHPDLRQLAREILMIDRFPTDEDKIHGTAIAGIIGAKANNHIGVAGFAPDADLYSYAACRFDPTFRQTRCNSFWMALAVEAAARDHIDVLNLSLAGPDDPLMARLLREIAERGTIIVAAENETLAQDRFPANLPYVIAAGTPDRDPSVETVIRVQDEHLSTTVGGRYRFFYGASMSAARVTALVALMRQHAPDLDVATSRTYLRNPDDTCSNGHCIMRFALIGSTAERGMMD